MKIIKIKCSDALALSIKENVGGVMDITVEDAPDPPPPKPYEPLGKLTISKYNNQESSLFLRLGHPTGDSGVARSFDNDPIHNDHLCRLHFEHSFVGIYKTLLERVLIAFDFEGRERFERDIKEALAALDAGPETGE